MNLKIWFSIWERDKGVCQKCNKKLYKIVNSKEEAEKCLKDIKQILIYKWDEICWKCGQSTPWVSYDINVIYNFMIGDIPRLDEILSKKFQFVKKIYSQTIRDGYLANMCIHCGATQGKFFVKDKFIDLLSEKNPDSFIVSRIDNNLTLEDFNPPLSNENDDIYEEKLDKLSHVHHRDKNRNNNELDNLILLCRDCHYKLHSEMRKIER